MRGWVNVRSIPENPLLCPVRSLQDYLARTSQLRVNTDDFGLFISLIKPHKSVKPPTLARWLRETLSAAGIDISMFAPHSTRSALAALQKSNQAATATQICKAAHWSLKSGTYKRFYNRVVLNT